MTSTTRRARGRQHLDLHRDGRRPRSIAAVSALFGVLSVSVAVIAAAATPAQASSPTDCANLQIQAHRGYHMGAIAENTIRSFDQAAARGYMIETDVRADSQGQLWIFHDRNVLRATGVNANIDQLTTSQVAALRYKKDGYPLPTIQDAIARWQSYDPSVLIYAEPKSQSIATSLVPFIENAGLESRVLYTANQTYIHGQFPTARLLARSSTSVPDPQTFVDGGYSEVMFGPTQLTSSDVDAYHAKGLTLDLRTSNSTGEWRRVIGLGFDAILTDLPNTLKSFCPSALSAPQISSFSPGSGSVGDSVVITGAAFTDASRVRFGTVSAPYTVDSASQITAKVPAGVSGNVAISVDTPNGTATSSGTFTIPLEITGFSPDSGPRGSTVTITGDGFTGADRIRFGQVDAPDFQVVSDSQITVTVPPTAPAASKIAVRTPSGTVVSATTFKVPPAISSFTPTAGGSGTTVTVTGSGFTGATQVKFGSVSATFTVDSDSQISATVPANVPSGSKLQVATPGGTTTSNGSFGTASPSVTSFAPASGGVGDQVTITGSGLTGATSVAFGSVAATSFTVDSDTQVTAVVPAGLPAKSTISVTTPAGSGSSAASFTLLKPTITSFSPGSGSIGSTVTITGRYFSDATTVNFGNVAAQFTVDSDTQVTVTVPPGAPARSKVNVRTAAGSVQSTDFFNVTG